MYTIPPSFLLSLNSCLQNERVISNIFKAAATHGGKSCNYQLYRFTH